MNETTNCAQPTTRVSPIFNGKYTIESPKGGHRTLRIKTQKADARFAPGSRILALLTGPDNNNDYRGFAFVNDDGIRVWGKKRGTDGKKSDFEWYALMLWDLATKGEDGKFFKLGYRLLIEGACIRCNRTLTEPESIRTGIGPVCAGRV